ncbi:MAG: saccharopine dehydrogenase NADP-binding domain-containing protein [Thermoleophilia bacterium]
MRIAVIGAGAMGRWAVKQLGLDSEVGEVVVGDFDEVRAREVAAAYAGGKSAAVFVDARDAESVKRAIAGCDALVNATQHFWNIAVMHAAAAAGVQYTDMGGLFHVTRQQVELDAEFKEAGVTAVIAMGGAPGVTNVLARYGAERLDTVEEAHALCGNVDRTDWSGYEGWAVPYSLETLCDEFSVVAPELIDGGWNLDLSGGEGAEALDFGAPAGSLAAHYTIHSEPFTFWHAWKERGLRSATFRLSLPPELTAQMRFLHRIGMTRSDEVEVRGARVRPRDVLLEVVSQLPGPTGVVLDDVDYLLGIVRGRKDGRRLEWRVRAVVPAHKEYGAGGGDVDTGVPPAIVARLMASGEIAGPGVFVPEQIVPCERLFAELALWGVTVDAQMREVVAAPGG